MLFLLVGMLFPSLRRPGPQEQRSWKWTSISTLLSLPLLLSACPACCLSSVSHLCPECQLLTGVSSLWHGFLFSLLSPGTLGSGQLSPLLRPPLHTTGSEVLSIPRRLDPIRAVGAFGFTPVLSALYLPRALPLPEAYTVAFLPFWQPPFSRLAHMGPSDLQLEALLSSRLPHAMLIEASFT